MTCGTLLKASIIFCFMNSLSLSEIPMKFGK